MAYPGMQLVTVEGMQEEINSGRRSHGTRRSAGKVQRHAPIKRRGGALGTFPIHSPRVCYV